MVNEIETFVPFIYSTSHNKVVPSHLTRCLITSVDLTHTCKPYFIPYCKEMSSRLSGRALIQWLESEVKRQNHQNHIAAWMTTAWLWPANELLGFAHLSERCHSKQRVVRDGMVSEVRRRTQRFDTAHLPFRTTEETSRVTWPHPHHPPENKRGESRGTNEKDAWT